MNLSQAPIACKQRLNRVLADRSIGGKIRDVDRDGSTTTTTVLVVVTARTAIAFLPVLVVVSQTWWKGRSLSFRFRFSSLLGPDSRPTRVDIVAAVVDAFSFAIVMLLLFLVVARPGFHLSGIAFLQLCLQRFYLLHLVQLLQEPFLLEPCDVLEVFEQGSLLSILILGQAFPPPPSQFPGWCGGRWKFHRNIRCFSRRNRCC
mmetsp:Transcript_12528/g.26502  ORF Transcript_12528/g.26502 Transcript_12528/m.26502 type:complete len:203 (-) Transcript_12528:814-1422(-)